MPMLDVKTHRGEEGRLSFTVYRKPTHTDQYLQFTSNQPLQHKLGVIRTLHHRAQTLCSTEEAKLQEIEHLQRVLSISGYSKSAWVTATKPKPKTLSVPDTAPTTSPNTKKSITLPYFGPTSYEIARRIREAGVAVHLRPFNTIRSQLVHPKDKVERDDKCGTVYHIKCDNCDAHYVGETGRALGVRIKEHRRNPSHVHAHCQVNNHTFKSEEVAILHSEPNWFRRGVAEAIHILQESPDINRDQGRHKLPAIYREILCSEAYGSASVSRTTDPKGNSSQHSNRLKKC